jgi:CubicO group peptidase (beta-lactamase class C family)
MNSRRSFILRAGSAAAAYCGRFSVGAARRDGSEGTLLPGHDQLAESERSSILDAMAKEDIPGVAVCLICDGRPAWIEGFGVTDRRAQRPVSAATIFSIQSTSKNITAVAVLMAVQQGLLDLDVPITEYLRDFNVRSRFEARPQAKMTLRLLLSHRAGFTHETPVGNNYAPEFPDFEAHVRSISQTWLRFPVGERYRYSNLGVDLAGYIVQLRSGMPFADWVKTVVFEPLGMSDSTVATDDYAARRNRALGHQRGYSDVPLKTPLIPSGGVYTSARDMAAYSLFHLNHGKLGKRVLLREDLWKEMHGFSLGGDYGLGVIRQELRYGETPVRLLSHQGGGFGFGCLFEYCPEAGLAWTALFNRPADVAYRFGNQLVEGVLTARYGHRKPRLPVTDLASIELPAGRQEQLIGHYVGRSFTREIRMNSGQLAIQEGSTFVPLELLSPTVGYLAKADGDSTLYDLYDARADVPSHLECAIGEQSLDYNDGPHDPAGPDKQSWTAFLGNYRIYQWGQPSEMVAVRRKNGWLYVNHVRLILELEPGLFFTSDGEAVDFRNEPPTWRNLRLQRTS